MLDTAHRVYKPPCSLATRRFVSTNYKAVCRLNVVTFAERVKKARERAKLSQAELARRLGLKQQAIQYLEDRKNNARGSKHTAGIARECGVDPNWLSSGQGQMLRVDAAKQPEAAYAALSTEAREVALAWSRLSLELQGWLREIIFMLATVEKKYPWLRRGRPKGESYDQYERRVEQNFEAMVQLAADREKKR